MRGGLLPFPPLREKRSKKSGDKMANARPAGARRHVDVGLTSLRPIRCARRCGDLKFRIGPQIPSTAREILMARQSAATFRHIVVTGAAVTSAFSPAPLE